MSSDPSRSRVARPDDALPPVEPPSAGFIVQLFVVPGVIVVVVVLIWVLFNWLAQKGNDRDAFVRALSRNNEGRWQAALNLANELRREQGSTTPSLSNDPELAKQLAGILKKEIESGNLDENSILLRVYLCRALGHFRVPDALPTLMEAATTVRDEKEDEVRRAALEGIAMLAANVGDDKSAFRDNAKLQEILFAAAADANPLTRSVASVGIGVIGTPAMIDKLKFMLDDANPNVRYNAATRLAGLGDASAVPVLVEMLDQKETAGVDIEEQEEAKPFKRAVITVNALRAAGQLAQKNHDADLAPLREAVEQLLAGDPSPEIRIEAKAALQKFKGEQAATVP